MPASSVARLRMRHPVPGVNGGGLYVSEVQRTRLLDAAFAVVAEDGYRGMAVRRLAERAGVSSKTFYDLFSDREDCFLAAFDHGVRELESYARPAFEAEKDWASGVRGGLGVLLGVLDRQPALRRLVVVEALGVGPRVHERRAEVLRALAGVVDQGRTGAKARGELPPLTAEGVVGGVFGVVYMRLLERGDEPLLGLLNGLMAMIVLPYRGRAAAAQELQRPVLEIDHLGQAGPVFDTIDKPAKAGRSGRTSGSRARLTVRTQMVLAAIAAQNERGVYPSNREISELVGIADQGQISRLMMRLQEQNLVQNTGGETQGISKAWQLTRRGTEVLDLGAPAGSREGPRENLHQSIEES